MGNITVMIHWVDKKFEESPITSLGKFHVIPRAGESLSLTVAGEHHELVVVKVGHVVEGVEHLGDITDHSVVLYVKAA